ncbi:ABC transporter permease [Halopenitus persicus]|uniref:Spermidine/putrescine transport system permease protein n=1 Tax=Halopenitus persicus TaxID=1048396 RepID=A0A1H3HBC6_9EURY|nr:ABC transporter permease [Halopenitus persicus]SDY12781.1 spermidine/putrescine transport system permease protein [Halopenitus persicus]
MKLPRIRSHGRGRTLRDLALTAPAVAVMVGIGLFSLVWAIYFSFWPMEGNLWNPGFSLEHYRALFDSTRTVAIFAKTLAKVLVIAVVTTAMAFPVAWYGGQTLDGRAGALFILVAIAPFWTNYIVRTWAWMLMLGDKGLINEVLTGVGAVAEPISLLYTEFAVIATMVYIYLPYSLFAMYGSVDAIPGSQIEAAYDLGSNRFEVLRYVILPLAMPGIVLSFVFIFGRAIGAYVTPELVGSPRTLWYGNVLVNQFKDSFNWPLGAAYSVVLFAFVLVVLAGLSRWLTLRKVMT